MNGLLLNVTESRAYKLFNNMIIIPHIEYQMNDIMVNYLQRVLVW